MLDRLRRLTAPMATAAISLGAALLLGELTLRLLLPGPGGYFVYPPGLRQEFWPEEALMPGVSGPSRFQVNSLGLRGDDLGSEHTYRILALGGSTTQCLYLDQAEAWPQQLQDLLGERLASRGRIWVGNAGKAGRRLPEHRLQLEHLLPAIEDLDAVVMLLGANDLNRRLNEDAHYRPADPSRPEEREALLERAFDVYPRHHALVPPRRTALWQLVDRAVQRVEIRRHWQMIQDRRGTHYQLWRERRAQASRIRDGLPDLGTALEAYRSDLEAVRDLTGRFGVRVVFLTQPHVYREDLPEELSRLLWMGWVGERQTERGQEYYSAGALSRAYEAFNDALRRFCRETGSECLDLEPVLPKDTRSFYDDIHFNEGGALRVARAVAEHFAASPPFSAPIADRARDPGGRPAAPAGAPAPRRGTSSTARP